MRTVFRIFFDDVKSIGGHFFVLVIVLGLAVLPALYAWVNIFAMDDPYVNTGQIPVAVASSDPGYQLEDGSYENAAGDVIDELKKDDNIGWQFPQTAEEAIAGVHSGEYYAAIVFEKNFTYDMYNLEETLVSKESPITYYYNEKKNAIATKITDTAAEGVLHKINTRYLETLFDQIFHDTNEVSDELDSVDVTDEALQQLRESQAALHDFNASINQFYASSDDIKTTLEKAEEDLSASRSRGRSDLAKAEQSIGEAKRAVKVLKEKLNGKITRLDKALSGLEASIKALQEAVNKAADEQTIKKLAETAQQKAEKVLTILRDIRALIPDTSKTYAARIAADTLDDMILRTEEIIALIKEDPVANANELMEATVTLSQLRAGSLVPAIQRLADDFERAIRITEPLLTSVDGMLDGIDPVLETAGDTMGSLDGTLQRLQVVLTELEEDLGNMIEQVESADEDERADLLTELMGGDPNKYSRFFSSLVEVKNHELYPVTSYGAAMTPFYTILAIWVGGVVLASLLRTNVNRRKFPQITETQGFFGRFLIFFLVGQMQAAIIVAGDIFLLHCQPVHPWLMWFSASVTSLVFVILIYALVLGFGNVGKAVVVVVMVLQISGSSGSYPIEILPEIYSKIYKFFPFPYAINSMREAMCGTYGHDYLIYLGQLMIFGVVGAVIGLLVRRPFINMNRFVTEKLEETEVL